MIDPNRIPTRTTLASIPGRVLTFLGATARSLPIRGALATVGYDEAAARLGWQLLLEAEGYDVAVGAPAPMVDEQAAGALTAVDQWDNKFLPRAAAVLAFDHPADHAVLFANNLRPVEGTGSLLVTQTFLGRLDELSPAALAALASVGLDAAERQRAAALVDRAQTFAPVEAPPAEPEVDFHARLVALWRWYSKWTALARTVVTKRSHLIQLGLATPKKRKKDEPVEPIE